MNIERNKDGQHEQTILEHVAGNVSMAIDQTYAYGGLVGACDAFAQNTIDSVLDDGYTGEDAMDAANGFSKLFQEKVARLLHETAGTFNLVDSDTNEDIRHATAEEVIESVNAGHEGHILVDGRKCYVA